MYDLFSMFKTKVPYPPRGVLSHHIVIQELLDISNCNVDIVDIIESFWLYIVRINSLSLKNIDV